LAKRHVAEAEERIGRQRAIIEKLMVAGHDVSAAQALLATLESPLKPCAFIFGKLRPSWPAGLGRRDPIAGWGFSSCGIPVASAFCRCTANAIA
jgi:hypothetical protein